MKSLSSNFIVTAVGLTVITTFSALFYYDLNKKIGPGSSDEIGVIKQKLRVAERKYANHVVWEEVDQSIPVYNNDTIRTAENSEARITLKDGTDIELNENSMILLAMTKDKIDIEFAQGSMNAKRDNVSDDSLKKLSIKSKDSAVMIAKSDISVTTNKGADMNLTVNKGDAQFFKGKVVRDVRQDQKLTSDAGDIEIHSLNLKLIDPPMNKSVITVKSAESIAFSWEPVKGTDDIFLEISANSSFRKKTVNRKITGSSGTVSLGSGVYYWRLRGINKATKKVETSESRRLTIVTNEPPRLIAPGDKRLINYRSVLPMIKFLWSRSDSAADYKLTIAKDPDLKNIIRSIKLMDNSFVFDSLEKGTYYWKVDTTMISDSASNILSSGINSFTIAVKAAVDPPELISPADGKNMFKSLIKKQDLSFSWRKGPEIAESKITIANDPEFKNVIHASSSKINVIRPKINFSEGKYYWRVTGILNEKDSTAPSITRSFRVVDSDVLQLVGPKDKEIVIPSVDEEGLSVRFSWSRTDVKGKYNLQLSKDAKFTSIYRESTVEHNSELIRNIDQGQFYWRVRFLDDTDNTILMKSGTRSITVKNELTAPVIYEPANGSIVNLENKDFISLKWRSPAGANLYKIQLFYLKDETSFRIFEAETKKNSFDVTDVSKLQEGKFMLTLQALETARGDTVRESPTMRTRFEVKLPKPVEKVKMTTKEIFIEKTTEKPRLTSPKIIYTE